MSDLKRDNYAKDIEFDLFSEWFSISENSPSGLVWRKDCPQRGRFHKNFRSKGDIAGSLSSRNYWRVTLGGKTYPTSRIVYCLYNNGIDRDKLVDHIDGNSLNNRVENLRLVDFSINGRNRKLNNNNTTGFTGISRQIIPNRSGGYNEYYVVCLRLNGKVIRKHFNILKLGEENALNLALSFKKSFIIELITDNYTERHLNEK